MSLLLLEIELLLTLCACCHRLIRGIKNRYGAIEEVGVFSMDEKGLQTVPNPSALFLTHRDSSPGVSSAVTVQMEGSRPLLLEVQALCSPVQVCQAQRTQAVTTAPCAALIRSVKFDTLRGAASLNLCMPGLHQ